MTATHDGAPPNLPVIAAPGDADALVGERLPPSPWLTVTQGMIDDFAAATSDRQWLHVDPDRARLGPYGTTIAHGFLLLSLIPRLLRECVDMSAATTRINYGTDRVRFPAALPSESRIRAHATLTSATPVGDGVRITVDCHLEREGNDRPVCVAQVFIQLHFAIDDGRRTSEVGTTTDP